MRARRDEWQEYPVTIAQDTEQRCAGDTQVRGCGARFAASPCSLNTNEMHTGA